MLAVHELIRPDEHPEEVTMTKHPGETWKVCACNYTMDEMEERMKGAENQRVEDGRDAERAVGAKEEAERGRLRVVA